MRLVGAVARFPQQRGAENADDAQVEDEAGHQHPDGPQEGGPGSVGQEPRPPRRHVRHHTLHLEVGPHHGADVEQLVAVACVRGEDKTECRKQQGRDEDLKKMQRWRMLRPPRFSAWFEWDRGGRLLMSEG